MRRSPAADCGHLDTDSRSPLDVAVSRSVSLALLVGGCDPTATLDRGDQRSELVRSVMDAELGVVEEACAEVFAVLERTFDEIQLAHIVCDYIALEPDRRKLCVRNARLARAANELCVEHRFY